MPKIASCVLLVADRESPWGPEALVKRGRHSVLIASGVPPTLHPKCHSPVQALASPPAAATLRYESVHIAILAWLWGPQVHPSAPGDLVRSETERGDPKPSRDHASSGRQTVRDGQQPSAASKCARRQPPRLHRQKQPNTARLHSTAGARSPKVVKLR